MRTSIQFIPILFVLGACEPRTEVVAGDVIVGQTSTGLYQLRGDFEIRETKISRAVIDASIGGACLVAQLPNSPEKCLLDSDCDIRPNAADPTKRWGGYCMPEDPANADSPKRCWVKPSPNYCAKDLKAGKHSTPTVDGQEVYQYAMANPSPPRTVRWRVTACLNGPLAGAPPCAGGEGTMMRDFGPITEPRSTVPPIQRPPNVPPRQPAPEPGPGPGPGPG